MRLARGESLPPESIRMRRQPSPLHRVAAVLVASFAGACHRDHTGLADIPPDATSPSTTTTSSTPDSDAGIGSANGPAGPPVMLEDDASSPAAPGSEGGPASPPLADADLPDVRDVTGPPDASKADAGPLDCDLDGDGFRSSADGCAGTDCCDRDARAFPGQTSFFTSADACSSFDYNCNGKDDPEFAKVNCTLAVLSCDGSGFEAAAPACGDAATFDTCHFLLACFTSQSSVTQGCR